VGGAGKQRGAAEVLSTDILVQQNSRRNKMYWQAVGTEAGGGREGRKSRAREAAGERRDGDEHNIAISLERSRRSPSA
jgi:hypothetical protein